MAHDVVLVAGVVVACLNVVGVEDRFPAQLAMDNTIGYESYSDSARRVLLVAQREADMAGSAEVSPDHLLLAVMRLGDEPFAPFEVSLPLDSLRLELEQAVVSSNQTPRPRALTLTELPPFSASLNEVLRTAGSVAMNRGEKRLEIRHLVAGIAEASNSTAAQLLDRHGLTALVARSARL